MRAIFSRLLNAPIFARWAQPYAEWRLAQTKSSVPAPDADGLPFPSSYLMARVAGIVDWRDFERSGKEQVSLIQKMIAAQGGDIATSERILDFGCGCGRLARHIPAISQATLYGCDYNRQLVSWCASNLPGIFQRNQLKPPLRYDDAFFDVIYLYSVFTHLREDTQKAWLLELHRVLKPGGYLVISFHDEDHYALEIIGVSADYIVTNQFHVHNNHAEGSNYLSTYQSRAHFTAQAAEHFDVLDVKSSSESERGVGQAIAIMRR